MGQATVLVADGKLILFNDSGELILARADATEYYELGASNYLRISFAGRRPRCGKASCLCAAPGELCACSWAMLPEPATRWHPHKPHRPGVSVRVGCSAGRPRLSE